MKILVKTVLSCALTLGVINTASAYVGPGAGLSLLGALWGLLAAVLAALAFIVLWPFRKMLKGRRNKAAVAPVQAQAVVNPGTPAESSVAQSEGRAPQA
jgi:membrane protein implicated in regulation of membrane protease activity